MKIGDEVYIHGYVDEIRGDTVIIKNSGGYFGTSKKEVDTGVPWFQLAYPTDKFSVIVHDGKIQLLNKNEVSIRVKAELNADFLWDEHPWK